jgi:hypothetical protein
LGDCGSGVQLLHLREQPTTPDVYHVSANYKEFGD